VYPKFPAHLPAEKSLRSESLHSSRHIKNAKGCCSSTGETADYILRPNPRQMARSRMPRPSAKERNTPRLCHGQSARLQRAMKRESFPRDARVALFTAPRDKCGVQQKHISRLNVCPARDVANIARCSTLCSDNQTNIKFHIHE